MNITSNRSHLYATHKTCSLKSGNVYMFVVDSGNGT